MKSADLILIVATVCVASVLFPMTWYMIKRFIVRVLQRVVDDMEKAMR